MPTLSRISLWHRLPSFLVIKATPGSSGPQPQLWPPWSLTLTMPRLTRPRSLQISQQTKLWYSLQHCNSSQSSYFYWGLSANLTTQSPRVISSVKKQKKNKIRQLIPWSLQGGCTLGFPRSFLPPIFMVAHQAGLKHIRMSMKPVCYLYQKESKQHKQHSVSQRRTTPIQTMAMSKGRIQLSILWVQNLYEVEFVSILRFEQMVQPNFLFWMNIGIKECRSCEIEEYRCDFRGGWIPIQFACSVC